MLYRVVDEFRFFGGICSQCIPGSHKLEAVGSYETLDVSDYTAWHSRIQ